MGHLQGCDFVRFDLLDHSRSLFECFVLLGRGRPYLTLSLRSGPTGSSTAAPPWSSSSCVSVGAAMAAAQTDTQLEGQGGTARDRGQ